MKALKKSAIAAVAAAAMAGGMLTFGAQAAFAAAPTYEPDPSAIGTLTFYNAAGQQITSGTYNPTGDGTGAPMAAYYLASGSGVAGDVNASVAFATPQDAVPTASWTTVNTQTSSQAMHNASYPGILGTSPNAVVQGDDFGLGFQIFTNPSTSVQNPNTYQIRLYTLPSGQYYSADVTVSNGTWTQVYPAVATNTTTQLTASPSPANSGQTVTLTATETPATAGSVQFKDGTTNIGPPVPVNVSGVATTTTSFTVAAGNPPVVHNLSAVFTPTDTASFSGSTGTFDLTVNPPATATSTGLVVNHGTDAGTAVSMVATVSPSAAPGSVAFFDNGTAIPGTVTQNPAGTYTLDLPGGLPAGQHSIVAKFSPTDVTQFQASQSDPVAFTLSAPAGDPCNNADGQEDNPNDSRSNTCIDDQSFKVHVPTGTLVISTPWTPQNPFDLGTMQLSADGTYLHASAPFGTAGATPAWSDGVTITDTRSGDLPWHADVTTNDFTKGADSINGCNLGFTTVAPHYIPANAIDGLTANKTVTTTDQPNGGNADGSTPPQPTIYAPGQACTTGVKGGTHTFASIPHGTGTVYVGGLMNLYAPTSTPPGDYFATVTFTVFTS